MNEMRCQFCNATRAETGGLVISERFKGRICPHCIENARKIVRDDQRAMRREMRREAIAT